MRHVDGSTGVITTVAGTGARSFTGDGGPALRANLNEPIGITVDLSDNIFFADSNNNRIRAVYACVDIAPPSLAEPADGATSVPTSPTLSWSNVLGAFRYDVYLDPVFPPSRLVGSDLTVTSFSPSNLIPGTTYYWRVAAKGDPFCVPSYSNVSAVRSFTTSVGCDAPQAFGLTAPADGATSLGSSVLLSWQAAAGASTYDVFLGPSNPPALLTTTTATSLSVFSLLPGTTYYWNVVARAACDRSKTTATTVRSFSVAGGCPAPAAFVQIAPAPGAADVPTTTSLEWSASANASTYDLYLGTTTPPPIYLPDLSGTRLTISGFAPGRTYHWRVAAKAACNARLTVSTPISSFTIRSDCSRPQSTSLNAIPQANVVVGQTYVLSWSDAPDLALDGYYVVERSLSDTFATIGDISEPRPPRHRSSPPRRARIFIGCGR